MSLILRGDACCLRLNRKCCFAGRSPADASWGRRHSCCRRCDYFDAPSSHRRGVVQLPTSSAYPGTAHDVRIVASSASFDFGPAPDWLYTAACTKRQPPHILKPLLTSSFCSVDGREAAAPEFRLDFPRLVCSAAVAGLRCDLLIIARPYRHLSSDLTTSLSMSGSSVSAISIQWH